MKGVLITVPALACALSACTGQPPSLPVKISHCNAASASEITATVRNESERPVKRIRIIADFYQNFRSLHGTASGVVSGELDPNQERELKFTFDTPLPASVSGRASRCVASRIDYLDGTSQSLPDVKY